MPKVVNEKIVYSGKFKVIQGKVNFGNEEKHAFEYAEYPDIVAMVPLNDNDVFLVKEWRVAYRKYVLQIPAGKCYETTEEGRIQQAHNELQEEIGMDAKTLEKLYSGLLMAHVKSRVNIYLATNLYTARRHPDPDEKIEVVRMPFNDAVNLFMRQREETLSYSLLGLLLAKQKLKL